MYLTLCNSWPEFSHVPACTLMHVEAYGVNYVSIFVYLQCYLLIYTFYSTTGWYVDMPDNTEEIEVIAVGLHG